MFLRRKKARSAPEPAPSSPPAPGAPLIRHLGEMWHVLQQIALEEDPRFERRSIIEHFNASAEGQRDILRWLAIYELRLQPSRDRAGLSFTIDALHPRHRGHALVPRNWPEGLAWEAIDEATLRRAPLDRVPDPAALRAALDAWLDARPGA